MWCATGLPDRTVDALTLVISRYKRQRPIASTIQNATLIQNGIVVSPRHPPTHLSRRWLWSPRKRTAPVSADAVRL